MILPSEPYLSMILVEPVFRIYLTVLPYNADDKIDIMKFQIRTAVDVVNRTYKTYEVKFTDEFKDKCLAINPKFGATKLRSLIACYNNKEEDNNKWEVQCRSFIKVYGEEDFKQIYELILSNETETLHVRMPDNPDGSKCPDFVCTPFQKNLLTKLKTNLMVICKPPRRVRASSDINAEFCTDYFRKHVFSVEGDKFLGHNVSELSQHSFARFIRSANKEVSESGASKDRILSSIITQAYDLLKSDKTNYHANLEKLRDFIMNYDSGKYKNSATTDIVNIVRTFLMNELRSFDIAKVVGMRLSSEEIFNEMSRLGSSLALTSLVDVIHDDFLNEVNGLFKLIPQLINTTEQSDGDTNNPNQSNSLYRFYRCCSIVNLKEIQKGE